MSAKEKAVEGAGTPTAASVDEFDRLDMSDSILSQNADESQRIATLIVKNLCRLYSEATGIEAKVVSVKRRQDMTTE